METIKEVKEMTSRRFGIEMEGYMHSNPARTHIKGARMKKDLSLLYRNWSKRSAYSEKNGVEVVSSPIKNLNIVRRIVGEMNSHKWSTDERAGTHVHIEIKDYTGYDKMKLLHFCEAIQGIVFMLVKNYRFGNQFCHYVDSEFRDIFKNEKSYLLNELPVTKSGFPFSTMNEMGIPYVDNAKYCWCNIYSSQHDTAEFRLFHAVTSGDEAVKFVKLANAIVDTAKNTSVEHLEFIIHSLNHSTTIEKLVDNFYYILGLDYEKDGLPIVGTHAVQIMDKKLHGNKSNLGVAL